MPEIHDTECAPTDEAPALAISVKLYATDVKRVDAWAKRKEATLHTQGLRMTVSRAAALRSLIMAALDAEQPAAHPLREAFMRAAVAPCTDLDQIIPTDDP